MIELNKVTILVDGFPSKQWPGLGLRSNLRFENLDDNSESLQGPFIFKSDVIRAINKYSDDNDRFNIYCCGQYVGGTEV